LSFEKSETKDEKQTLSRQLLLHTAMSARDVIKVSPINSNESIPGPAQATQASATASYGEAHLDNVF
jgi:hypothetical protein